MKSSEKKPAESQSSPPPAKLKYKPDVGWNEKISCYVCRALTVPPAGSTDIWYAWSKDIPVQHGMGLSEQEAINDLKKHVAAEIKKRVDANEPVAWIEISCLRTPGSQLRFIRVDAPAPPKVKPK